MLQFVHMYHLTIDKLPSVLVRSEFFISDSESGPSIGYVLIHTLVKFS